MEVKPEQRLNAWYWMSVTDAGIVSDSSWLQSLNTLFPIVTNDCPKDKLFIDVQPSKADEPIPVTDAGISTEVS